MNGKKLPDELKKKTASDIITKNKILTGIEKGKLKPISLKQLLDEL